MILDPGAEDRLARPARRPPPTLHDLLAPLPGDADALRAVGLAVNDARHDAEDCLDPPRPADAPPATLF